MKPLSAALRRNLERDCNKYRQALREAPADHPWNDWMASRGFDPTEIADQFRLGIVVDPRAAHEYALGWLAVPNLLRDRYGNERVAGLKFRNPDHSSGATKYMSPKGQEIRLYNLRALHEARNYIVLTEGETDTWACHYAGLPTVAIPGSNTWGGPESHRFRIFGSPSAPGFQRVILLQDPDAAGASLAAELEPIEGLEIKTFPAGTKDASEFLVKHGPDALADFVLAHDDKKTEDDGD